MANPSAKDAPQTSSLNSHGGALRGSGSTSRPAPAVPSPPSPGPEYRTFVGSADACVGPGGQNTPREESLLGSHISSTAAQVFVPFILAGVGSVFAGLLLDVIKDWRVFVSVRELFVLVPPLLGLNGNLEQTLVARLGTQANLGNLNRIADQLPMIFANIALLQCQSTVASTVACVFAVFKGVVLEETFEMSHIGIIFAGSLAAVNTASFFLSCVMSTVVVVATKCHKNPDNIAPAIAASFGDLTTLFLLSHLASFFLDHPYIAPVVIILIVASLPLWIMLARRNTISREVLRVGWFPIIIALTASSFGGYILDYAIIRYPPIGLHLSSVNALGGNLASVFSCTLSSYLNKVVSLGILPPGQGVCIGPLEIYYRGGQMSKVAIVLLGVVLPGQTLFVVLAKVLRFGYVSMSATYYTLYMCATLAQVMVLLYLARLVVYLLWRFSVDPDNAAIPFLTGCGDFLGTGFLTLAYVLLSKLGDATADDEHRFQALGRLSHRPSPPSSLPSSFPWSQPNATTTTYRGVTWT